MCLMPRYQGWWVQQVPLKSRDVSNTLHGATPQKTAIFKVEENVHSQMYVLPSTEAILFQLHWFTKKYYFSVTSTKVGELNSIFYAEFKFVLSVSISRKVFKWHRVIIWRKRILTYYINVFLHYLKSNCGWFPAVCRLWYISLEGPAVVSQHTEAPLALVPLFHVGNVLMKSLSVLVTDGTKILREEV
jgi:hypothetical protein